MERTWNYDHRVCDPDVAPRLIKCSDEFGLAQMVPSKFSHHATSWWNSLTMDECRHYSSDWLHLLDAICRHFLTAKWLVDRTQEFEEMRFRQSGHEREDPLDFYQRRIKYHSFIFSDAADGPQAVTRVLRTQPAEWAKDVNEVICPSMGALQDLAEHSRDSLISTWVITRRIHSLTSATSRPAQTTSSTAPAKSGFRRHRRANAADREYKEYEDYENSGEDEEESMSEEEEEEKKGAMAADAKKARRNPGTSGSKTPWPQGKTV